MSVVLKDIRKSYGRLEVIKSVNIEIGTGEFVVFVGPSGCGKSTLLRMVAGLETITSGTLHIEGEDVTDWPASKRGIAMVFQSYALYPHMTVFENMAFSLDIAKMPKADIAAKVNEAAEVLQLTPYLDRLPKALSGGQRQRVAIGRAIVRNPKVFLFDEPLSNLDAALRADMRIELTDLHDKIKATMIYVTHDQVEAMTLADRIVVLNAGEVEQIGSPMELYQRPQTPFVAGFIGSPKMNFLEGELAKRRKADILGIRPEHLLIGDTGPISGQVRHLEKLGADTLVYVSSKEHDQVLVRYPGIYDARPGQEVTLGFADEDMHLFSNGQRIQAGS